MRVVSWPSTAAASAARSRSLTARGRRARRDSAPTAQVWAEARPFAPPAGLPLHQRSKNGQSMSESNRLRCMNLLSLACRHVYEHCCNLMKMEKHVLPFAKGRHFRQARVLLRVEIAHGLADLVTLHWTRFGVSCCTLQGLFGRLLHLELRS